LAHRYPEKLPLSTKKALGELLETMRDVRIVCSRTTRMDVSRVAKEKGFSKNVEFLQDLVEKMELQQKILLFAVKISGCVFQVKESSLTKMIADPIACREWRKKFGDSRPCVPFEDVLRFMDSFFSEFGDTEFTGSCDSSSFFSYYRHEGRWVKCASCAEAVRKALRVSERDVGVIDFAAFCKDNLLESIRMMIESAHPSNADQFALIDPRRNRISELLLIP
jgi:hypothetical protein